MSLIGGKRPTCALHGKRTINDDDDDDDGDVIGFDMFVRSFDTKSAPQIS